MAGEAPQDDLTIVDEDCLFRCVRPIPSQLFTEEDGSRRPSSAVFRDTELSVNIESAMIEQGRSPDTMLDSWPGAGVTAIAAGVVRRYDREHSECHPIVRDGEPPNDSAHCLILGKKTSAFANAMRRNHVWVVPPST
jgi:hypothetical protein